MSYTDIMAALTSLPTVMQRYLAEGHMVKPEGIGTFYLSVQCSKTGIEKKKLCSAEQITNVKVQFLMRENALVCKAHKALSRSPPQKKQCPLVEKTPRGIDLTKKEHSKLECSL